MSDSFDKVFSKEEIYQIGKFFVENAGWHRVGTGDEKRSGLRIYLPYEANLGSTGSRVNEMNKLINETNK